MQPLVLYGHPWNRAARCLWMLRELALPHELKQVALLSSDFDELNPNRNFILRDYYFSVWRSVAQ